MKKTVITINCDSCDKDISPKESGYPRVDILKVSCLNVRIMSESGMTYAIAVTPMIPDDLYFCNLQCMHEYNPRGK